MERSRSTRSGASRRAASIASAPSEAWPTTAKSSCSSSAASASRVSGWSSTTRTRGPGATEASSAARARADEGFVQAGDRDDAYQSLLWSLVLLFGLLGASLALFASNPRLRTVYELPELRLVLLSAIVFAASLVAILAGVRFAVEGRRQDLLLSCGFVAAAASTLLFGIAPTFGGGTGRNARRLGGDPRPAARGGADLRGRVRARTRRAPRQGALALRGRDGARARRALGRAPRVPGRRSSGSPRTQGERPPAAARLHARAARALQPRRGRGLRLALPRRGPGPRPLARDRHERAPVRGAPPRVHAARDERAGLAERVPARARVRHPARRRLAGDPLGGVRPRRRRGAGPRRARDPRRPRAVPVRRSRRARRCSRTGPTRRRRCRG